MLAAAGAALLGVTLVSVSVGAKTIPLVDVWSALLGLAAGTSDSFVIVELRLPRVVASVVVGASLGVAGATMQALTRNPLAEPGIMGLNAGAVLALVIALLVLGGSIAFTTLVIVSFVGAAFGALLVYGIGTLSPGGLTPVRLALAGTAVTSLLTALASGIALYRGLAADVLYYTAGGLAGVQWEQVRLTLPWFAVGAAAALLLSRPLTVFALGEEVATGLGQRTGWVRAIGAAVVIVLAGSAVAIAGPVAFVGLVVPHVARMLVGIDYRWVIPASMLFGGLLMAVADLGARIIAAPLETPVGFVTALIGVPFFLWLVRRDLRLPAT